MQEERCMRKDARGKMQEEDARRRCKRKDAG
jgi:hypothetical protein